MYCTCWSVYRYFPRAMETRKKRHCGLILNRDRTLALFTIPSKIVPRGTLSERVLSFDPSLSDLFGFNVVRIVAIWANMYPY
jgi:hypothetical protein